MISWLLSQFGGYIAIVIAAAVAVAGAYLKGGQARENKLKAKEAEAREKVIDRLAAGAAAKPTGSVHDDPNNRDNRNR